MIRIISFITLVLFSSIAFADETSENIIDRKDYDPSRPYYQIMTPGWSAGVRTAIPRFPVKSAIGFVFELYGEKHLMFQKLGVLSAGLHFGLTPFQSGRYDFFKVGGLFRYQLHVIKNQLIVPTIAAFYDQYRIKPTATSTQGFGFSSAGLLIGAFFNLSFFDSQTARDGYQSMSILRTYLSLEFSTANINLPALTPSGNLWYTGLRFEFE